MTNVKDIVMDIISMYAVVGTDMIAPTRNEDTFWWDDEITNTLWKLFEIEPDITYSYSNDDFDCYAVRWKEGNERFKILVKVI